VPVSSPDSYSARRAAARRTAWWVAAIAIGFYGMFIYLAGRGA
jgi:hypothetical protein